MCEPNCENFLYEPLVLGSHKFGTDFDLHLKDRKSLSEIAPKPLSCIKKSPNSHEPGSCDLSVNFDLLFTLTQSSHISCESVNLGSNISQAPIVITIK